MEKAIDYPLIQKWEKEDKKMATLKDSPKVNLRTVLFLASVLLIVSNSCSLAHTDVTVEQSRELIDSTNDLIVVDVREPYEYCDTVGHIPGALNYPLSSGVLEARYEELPIDGPILVVCRSGGRSNAAANFLDSKNFSFAYDMMGGMSAWIWETEPCKDDSGTTASAQTNTYVFLPGQSTVVQTGGIAGVHWTFSVEGLFQLTVDPNAGTASFAHVDANATDDSQLRRTLDPNEVFNMTSHVGEFLDDTTISFMGKAADGSDVLITVTIENNLAYLAGQTTPPPNTADFFLFTLVLIQA
jgi:rhodanese-related sulfurtransferase